MNKKILWVLIPLVLIVAVILIIKNIPVQKFYLENKYYGSNEVIEISTSDLEKLIDEKRIIRFICLSTSLRYII